MLRRTFLGTAALAGGLLVGLHHVRADDKPKAPTGTWVKKEGQTRIEFVDKETFKVFPHGDKDEFAVTCSYTVDKDGVVKAKVTDLEGKAEIKDKAKNVIPVGTTFEFKFPIEKETAKLEDLGGDKADALKSHLEGDYELKK